MFRVFISSTFDDLKAERNALQQYVFPRLRELCRRQGTRFQPIDLRWGVGSEASLDQQTIPVCFEEVDRCLALSPVLNFVVLLGDRYGSRLPPPVIAEREFQNICQHLSPGERALLESWYLSDRNAMRARVGDGNGTETERCLRRGPVDPEVGRVLEKGAVAARLGSNELAKYLDSVTEQEINRGVLAQGVSQQHVLAFFRSIRNLDSVAAAPGTRLPTFCNLTAAGAPDAYAQGRLGELKDRLRHHIGPLGVYEYEAEWTGEASAGGTVDGAQEGSGAAIPISVAHIGSLPESLDECLELARADDAAEVAQHSRTGLPRPVNLCRDVFRRMAGIIIQATGEAQGTDDQLDQEIKDHESFAKERRSSFTGRARHLAAISQYLDNPQRRLLAVVGEPGTGKSALLAEAAHLASTTRQATVVVARFLGATPGSSDLRSLLTGLCRQLAQLYGADEDGMPADIRKLAEEFAKRLALATADRPLVLFLDALDQLADRAGVSRLTWLPASPPGHVAVVTSSLPGRYEHALAGKRPEPFIVSLPAMPDAEGRQLLSRWLAEANRTLQPGQWQAILPDGRRQVLPLWLKVAFEEARRWKSYSDIGELPLPADATAFLRDRLFTRLSKEHGQELLERSLTLIAAARNGLAEDELTDLLSEGPVLAELQQRSPASPSVTALPAVIWSRLFLDLRPYLTELSADGSLLLGFYHRQLAEAVNDSYDGDDRRRARHQDLAGYFAGQELCWESADTDTTPNLRKMSELAYQQVRGELWDAVRQTLSDISFLGGKTSYQGVDAVLTDLSWCVEHEQALEPVQRALEREARHLRGPEYLQRRGFFAQQLHNCAVTSQLTALAEAAQQNLAMLGASYLALRWRTGGGTRSLLHSFWVTTRTPPAPPMAVTPDGRRGIFTFTDGTLQAWDLDHEEMLWSLGHSGAVAHVVISAHGHRALSASGESGELTLWDLDNGNQLRVLTHQGGAWQLAMTPDGRRAVSASDDIDFWDLDEGVLLHTLTGHTRRIRALSISPDARRAASASWDGTYRVWDLVSGTPVRSCADDSANRTNGWDNRAQDSAIAADHRRAVSATSNARHFWDLMVCDLDRGIQPTNLPHGQGGRDLAVAITDDSRRAASVSAQKLMVWDLDAADPGAEPLEFPLDAGVHSVALTHGGRQAVVTTVDSTTSLPVTIWELETAAGLADGHPGPVTAVAISTNGLRAVSGAKDGSLKIWDLPTGTEIPIFARKSAATQQTAAVAGLAFTSDGSHIVCATEDSYLRIWDVRNEEAVVLQEILEHTPQHGLDTFAVTPDRNFVAATSENRLKLWDLQSCTLRSAFLIGGRAKALAITPDGCRVIAGWRSKEGGSLRVYDLHTGGELAVLAGNDPSLSGLGTDCIAVTPDGQHAVVTMSSWQPGASLRIWDLATQEVIFETTRTARADAVVASPDGRLIVSTYEDEMLSISDRRSHEELAVLAMDGRAWAVAVHGSTVLTGDVNGALHCLRYVE